MTLTLSDLSSQLVARGWHKCDTSGPDDSFNHYAADSCWTVLQASKSLDGCAWVFCTPQGQIHGCIVFEFAPSGELCGADIKNDRNGTIAEWSPDRLPSLDRAVEALAAIPELYLQSAELSSSEVDQLQAFIGDDMTPCLEVE